MYEPNWNVEAVLPDGSKVLALRNWTSFEGAKTFLEVYQKGVGFCEITYHLVLLRNGGYTQVPSNENNAPVTLLGAVGGLLNGHHNPQDA